MAGGSKTPGHTKDRPENQGSGMSHMAEEAKNKAQDAAAAVGQKAQDLAHRAQDAASDVAGKARDAASNLAGKARDAAAGVPGRADDAISAVGEKMSSLAGSLRDRAPHEGMVGSAASTVADKLQAGGQYLQEHGVSDMADDLMSMVRRYPVQSLLVGLGVGFLMGMVSAPRR